MTYKKIDRALKRTWLKALRSGVFNQTRGVLENKGGHCCIGVGYVACGVRAKRKCWGVGSINTDEAAIWMTTRSSHQIITSTRRSMW